MVGNPKARSEASRFAFGKNWQRYATLVDGDRVTAAERSIKEMLGVESLKGRRFLDVGSGSGLFSLAARNLGASVYSFDYDLDSVACTRSMKGHYWTGDECWQVEQGDVLDVAYLRRLGRFDVVYSWGVLHHTGDMWRAMRNVTSLLSEDSQLFVALYNDQRWLSTYWKGVKTMYARGLFGRGLVITTHAPYFLARRGAKSLAARCLALRETEMRGMDPWRDMIDWLGGYPFEVARPDAVLAFCRERGLTLERMKTVGGRHGCNEFVFRSQKATA